MSDKTRAVMPTDVAVMIAPTNNAGKRSCMESKLANPSHTVKPRRNGTITPPAATTVAGRA